MNERAGKQNIEMDVVKEKIQRFTVEIPSWGYGDSGTRFKVFHWPGAARTLREKFEDAAQVNAVTGVCPSVAMHIHWDTEDDWQAVKALAQGLGLRIGAVNPNLLQEDAYRLGSLSHIDKQLVVSVKSGQVLGRRVSWSRVKSEQHSHSPFEKPLHV